MFKTPGTCGGLADHRSEYIAFLISFSVIAATWTAHHMLFTRPQRPGSDHPQSADALRIRPCPVGEQDPWRGREQRRGGGLRRRHGHPRQHHPPGRPARCPCAVAGSRRARRGHSGYPGMVRRHHDDVRRVDPACLRHWPVGHHRLANGVSRTAPGRRVPDQTGSGGGTPPPLSRVVRQAVRMWSEMWRSSRRPSAVLVGSEMAAKLIRPAAWTDAPASPRPSRGACFRGPGFSLGRGPVVRPERSRTAAFPGECGSRGSRLRDASSSSKAGEWRDGEENARWSGEGEVSDWELSAQVGSAR